MKRKIKNTLKVVSAIYGRIGETDHSFIRISHQVFVSNRVLCIFYVMDDMKIKVKTSGKDKFFWHSKKEK